jgi:transglutaminase-like putative cysteine protease
VTLEDDYDPPAGGFYLRQEVWSAYDGHRLVSATGADVDRDLLDHFPVAEEPVAPPPADARAVVRGRVSVLVEHRLPFALEAPTSFAPAANPNPARFVRSWRFASLAQQDGYDTLLGHAAGSPTWTPAQWAHYTKGPADPRYAALAHRLVEGLPEARRDDAFAKALAVKVWLDANSKYSTAARHAGVDDPTADYLFGDLVGYCVHTAHAAVYLWRALGLPARIGAGYHVDAADRRGATLLVMSSMGHAWPELYLDGVGWVVLDIAPAENLDPPGQPLDEDLAALLAEMAKEPPPGETPTPPIDYAAVRDVMLRVGAGLLTLLLAALAALHLAAKVWRRLRPRWAAPAELPRVAYRVALDRLAEVGVTRAEGETRERFARRLADVYPALGPLTDLHLAGRLGRPGRPVAARPELQAAPWRTHLAALSAEIARAHGLPRRWAGILDPSSFWRAR